MATYQNHQSSLPPELQPFRFLTDKQVETLTGIKRQTLANQRCRGVGLPYLKVGGSIRYALRDVLDFMEAHRIQREG
jgi:hypothetical protein